MEFIELLIERVSLPRPAVNTPRTIGGVHRIDQPHSGDQVSVVVALYGLYFVWQLVSPRVKVTHPAAGRTCMMPPRSGDGAHTGGSNFGSSSGPTAIARQNTFVCNKNSPRTGHRKLFINILQLPLPYPNRGSPIRRGPASHDIETEPPSDRSDRRRTTICRYQDM